MATKKLASYVHVEGEDGQMYVFGPDDKVPDWAAKKMGDHVWAKDSSDEDPEVAGASQLLSDAERAKQAQKEAEAAAKASGSGSGSGSGASGSGS